MTILNLLNVITEPNQLLCIQDTMERALFVGTACKTLNKDDLLDKTIVDLYTENCGSHIGRSGIIITVDEGV